MLARILPVFLAIGVMVVQSADGASIAGRVTLDGTPLQDFTLRLHEPAVSEAGIAMVTTDANGDYLFTGLDAGTYTVGTAFVGPFGVLEEFWDDQLCLGCDASIGTPITVTAEEDRTGTDFTLRRAGSVTGRVTRSDDGRPVVGLVVGAQRLIGEGVFGNAPIAFTDANGDFTIGGLPTGQYVIDATAVFTPGVQNAENLIGEIWQDVPCPCPFSAGTLVSVTEGEATPGIDFALSPATLEISGQVTDAITGDPIEGVRMGAGEFDLELSGEPVFVAAGETFTDADGRYALGVPPGRYYLIANGTDLGYVEEFFDDLPRSTPLGDVTVIEITDTSKTDADFALASGSRIEGRVIREGGEPLENLLVVAVRDDGEAESAGLTDAGGNYVINGVVPGSYRVRTGGGRLFNVIDENFDDRQCPCDDEDFDPVVVGQNAVVTGIDFELESGGSFAGRVLDDRDDSGLGGLFVTVFDQAGQVISEVPTFQDGSYTVRGLRAGSYFARTSRAGTYSLVNETFDDRPCIGACDATLGTPIEVVKDVLRGGIDFRLSPVPVLADNTPVDLDALGTAVATDGDLLAIGVPGDDTGGEDAGAVLVFRRVGGAFQFEARLLADNPEPGARFGSSVAIEDGIVVVGAPGTPGGAKGTGPKPGIGAYVMQLTGNGGYQQLQQLFENNLANAGSSGYGTSVAISGPTIAVGAPEGQKDQGDASGAATGVPSGTVLIYDFVNNTSTWDPMAVLTDPAGAPGDGLGTAVAASGNRFAAGAPGKQTSGLVTGAASLFDRVAANLWNPPSTVVGEGAAEGDAIGTSVAIDGELMALGAPGSDAAAVDAGAAYLFRFDGDGLVQENRLLPVDPNLQPTDENWLLGSVSGRYGQSVALRGQTLAVGATREAGALVAGAGAAYIYARNAEDWDLNDRLVAEDGAEGDGLGNTVALGEDAIFVGAPGAANGADGAGIVLGAAGDVDGIFESSFEADEGQAVGRLKSGWRR